MTPTLFRFIGRQLLSRTVGTILVLGALLQVLDLIDSATDILQRDLGVRGIVYYALLRTPTIIGQVTILATLIAALLTIDRMVRANEMVILRGAGVTAFRIGLLMLPSVALVALGQFIVTDQIAPRTERALALWWSDTATPDDDDKAKPIWFRADGDLVAVGRVADSGTLLERVSIYRRDASDMLSRRTTAADATLVEGHWVLHQAVVTDFTGGATRSGPLAALPWTVDLDPETVIEFATPQISMSLAAVRAALTEGRASSRPAAFYETELHHALARPFACLVMVALALPAGFAAPRRQSNLWRLLGVLTAGLVFLVVEGVMVAFGEAGRLPAALAVWAPPIMFLSAAASVILYREER